MSFDEHGNIELAPTTTKGEPLWWFSTLALDCLDL